MEYLGYFIIKNKIPDAAGKVGQYFRFSEKVGVKIIGFYGCESIKNLHKSPNWVKAQQESNWLNLVNSVSLAPRSHGVFPVKFKGRFFAGVFMDHINGDSLNLQVDGLDFKQGCKVYVNKKGSISESGTPIRQYLKKKLDKVKVTHWDIHGENVLIDKATKKVWLIDFSPAYIRKKKG